MYGNTIRDHLFELLSYSDLDRVDAIQKLNIALMKNTGTGMTESMLSI